MWNKKYEKEHREERREGAIRITIGQEFENENGVKNPQQKRYRLIDREQEKELNIERRIKKGERYRK